MRLASLLLALGLSFGAASALRNPEPAADTLGFAALNQFPPDTAKAISLYQDAVQRDPANPYRWADLGFAYQTAENLLKARYCFARALSLSGALPAIWLRDANFHFAIGERDEALRSAAMVLRTVPDYDAVLFRYFDGFGVADRAVLEQIGQDSRPTRAFGRHLLGSGKADQAQEIWTHAFAKGFVDGPLANSYVHELLRLRRGADARRDWVQFLGNRRGDYPEDNLLFNGSFENEPSGSDFDWNIQKSEDVDTTRDQSAQHDGSRSLHVVFHGTANVSYANVIQRAVVDPGEYVLRAWVRTQDITTNECPRIEVFDSESPAGLDVATDGFCGTDPWRQVTLRFHAVSGTALISVRMVRFPTQKLDSKINGSLWIDNIRLTSR